MKNYTPEMVEKAKSAVSANKLLELAKELGCEMTAEEAGACFEQLHPKCGELDDEELDHVSGGGCSSSDMEAPAPAEPQLCAGQNVYLKGPGHTGGSCYCQNPVCASAVFRIAKQIDAEKYLLECMGCDWTYHAVKDNIVPL